jgi:hypothetical protein
MCAIYRIGLRFLSYWRVRYTVSGMYNFRRFDEIEPQLMPLWGRGPLCALFGSLVGSKGDSYRHVACAIYRLEKGVLLESSLRCLP